MLAGKQNIQVEQQKLVPVTFFKFMSDATLRTDQDILLAGYLGLSEADREYDETFWDKFDEFVYRNNYQSRLDYQSVVEKRGSLTLIGKLWHHEECIDIWEIIPEKIAAEERIFCEHCLSQWNLTDEEKRIVELILLGLAKPQKETLLGRPYFWVKKVLQKIDAELEKVSQKKARQKEFDKTNFKMAIPWNEPETGAPAPCCFDPQLEELSQLRWTDQSELVPNLMEKQRKLVEEHLGLVLLVINSARKGVMADRGFMGKWNLWHKPDYDADDLQLGYLGLCKAAIDFDETKTDGAKFTTFAGTYILTEICKNQSLARAKKRGADRNVVDNVLINDKGEESSVWETIAAQDNVEETALFRCHCAKLKLTAAEKLLVRLVLAGLSEAEIRRRLFRESVGASYDELIVSIKTKWLTETESEQTARQWKEQTVRDRKEALQKIAAFMAEETVRFSGEHLRVLLKQRYVTQSQLRRALRVKALTISKYLSGTKVPSYDKIYKIAEYLGVSVEYFLQQTTVFKAKETEPETVPAEPVEIWPSEVDWDAVAPFGRCLLRVMEQKRIGWIQLTQVLKIDRTTLADYIYGATIPAYNKVRRMAGYLGVSTGELLKWKDNHGEKCQALDSDEDRDSGFDFEKLSNKRGSNPAEISLGQCLTKLLKEKKISQTELAQRLGTNRMAIYRCLNGPGNPNYDLLGKIAACLNASVDAILRQVATDNRDHKSGSDLQEWQWARLKKQSQRGLNLMGQRLLELLREKKITLTQLAQAMGVSQSIISLYIKGIRFPTFETFCKMADCLNVAVDFFFAGLDGQSDLEVR